MVHPVPPGAHEFKFIVDGEWKHSNRHPTIGIDETSLNNVRVVLPEPQFDAQKTQNEVQAPFAKGRPTPSPGSGTPSDAGNEKGNKRAHTHTFTTKAHLVHNIRNRTDVQRKWNRSPT